MWRDNDPNRPPSERVHVARPEWANTAGAELTVEALRVPLFPGVGNILELADHLGGRGSAAWAIDSLGQRLFDVGV